MKKIFVLVLFIQSNNFVYSQPLCDFQGKDSLYVNIAGDTVHVWNIAACGYCSSAFAISVSMSADTLYITQTDTAEDVSLCGCTFNLKTSFVGLPSGKYWVMLYRDWPKNSIHQFIRSIQFTYTPTILQSLQWNRYQSGCIVDAVDEENHQDIKEYALFNNYPNPFNPSTTIRYVLPVSGFASLKVYDMLGREVAILVAEERVSGQNLAEWNASSFSSGIYFYRLQAGSFSETKKLMLLK